MEHYKNKLLIFVCVLLFVCIHSATAIGAVGCDLNNPDGDVPRLFPGSTSYKVSYASLGQGGDNQTYARVVKKLGGPEYTSLYAPLDVSYSIYEIYNGSKKIGYIHGVNQKGHFGGIQVFVVQDMNGIIKRFYIQKISGQSANKLRDSKFGDQFVGLSLKDLDTFDPITGKGTGKFASIRNPAPDMETDFYGVLRGVKKNLVLMDEFVFSKERQ